MASVSILITTFKRANLLYWGLQSISKQQSKHDIEVIVLNDGVEDETEGVCKLFKKSLNIKYIFSAANKNPSDLWRVPGFALNIGAKKAEGEYLFISCAEMFHVDDCIGGMTDYMVDHPDMKMMMVTNGRDDLNQNFLNRVRQTDGNPSMADYNKCGELNIRIPFLMGMRKKDYFEIGGYDEEFVGVGFEDNNFVERMSANGCKYVNSNCHVVHLYHPRIHGNDNNEIRQRMAINKSLLMSKRGQNKANIDREWGIF